MFLNNIELFYSKNKVIIISFFSFILVAFSWVLNIGWYRVLFVIPIVLHLVIFIIVNYKYYKKISLKLDFISKINIFSFYLFYIIFPDGGDTPASTRTFFGLIHLNNDIILSIFSLFSIILLVFNIIIIFIQLYKIRK